MLHLRLGRALQNCARMGGPELPADALIQSPRFEGRFRDPIMSIELAPPEDQERRDLSIGEGLRSKPVDHPRPSFAQAGVWQSPWCDSRDTVGLPNPTPIGAVLQPEETGETFPSVSRGAEADVKLTLTAGVQ